LIITSLLQYDIKIMTYINTNLFILPKFHSRVSSQDYIVVCQARTLLMTTTQDLSFPNRFVKVDTKRQTFENKLQNLIPRIGFLMNTPILPQGSTFYDRVGNTLYYSTGTVWIPVANAASFITSTNTACDPDVSVVIEPSTFITGTDVGVALVPRGTGGISLSAPDLTPAGGNCRGESAVDLQIKRAAATQIASGITSGIGGGENNEASGTHSCVPGGLSNTASGNISLAAGRGATASFDNSMCFSCDSVATHSTTMANEFKIGLNATSGRMTIDNLPAFADDTAAGVGGLTVGMMYQTNGSGAPPLNSPGIIMIKQ
jgi:hypothetical protein